MNNPKKIGIIGGGLAPVFNEAMANQILLLSEKLDAQVITTNDLGIHPFIRLFNGRYFIINSKFILKNTVFLSLINGCIIYLLVKYFEKLFDRIIIPGGVNSVFLKYLDNKKCILIITSLPKYDIQEFEKVLKICKGVQSVIVQSERTKRQLLEIGVDGKKIQLLFPLINFSKFNYVEPNNSKVFTILFASAPTIEDPDEDNFSDKGVHLLLEAFKKFSDSGKYDCKLILIWRNAYNQRLSDLLNSFQLNEKVEVINSIVEMKSYYLQADVTIIPYTTLFRSPEIPLSALESIACGRPVITTNIGEISDIIKENACGVVSNPDVLSLFSAMIDCKENYYFYQKNCINIKKLQAICDDSISC